MTKWIAAAGALLLVLGTAPAPADEPLSATQATNRLEIRSVAAGGRLLSWHTGSPLSLKPFPEAIVFSFGAASNSSGRPIRLRYRLEGYDPTWQQGCGAMFLAIRFWDAAGEQVGQKFFHASGESPGWKGALRNATLTHRRETLVVPPRAARIEALISSAGPPATVGLFVVNDLVVSRLSASNGPTDVLVRSPFGHTTREAASGQNPWGWIRDGTRPSMARVVELGENPSAKTLAILDEDPLGHAEWRSRRELAPRIAPGEQLLVEWNELFSMGMSDVSRAFYDKLPSGHFRFRVEELTALGVPTGAETSLVVTVPPPFWKRSWFWGGAVLLLLALSVAGGRYLAWRRMRRKILRLKQQHLVEQERVRIAQNIHDDLGARVTQISLLSGLAQGNASFPEKARADFGTISRMSRELVSALYETVWTVNPENDHLEALGNYLCQMVNQLCAEARLRCRLHVVELPPGVQVSSQTRHHVTLAVKEALHNVLKHARASEVTLHVALTGKLLTVSLQDDGCGFDPAAALPGHGLTNLRRRLAELGGTCSLTSQPGRGTTVRLSLEVGLPNGAPGSKPAPLHQPQPQEAWNV